MKRRNFNCNIPITVHFRFGSFAVEFLEFVFYFQLHTAVLCAFEEERKLAIERAKYTESYTKCVCEKGSGKEPPFGIQQEKQNVQCTNVLNSCV